MNCPHCPHCTTKMVEMGCRVTDQPAHWCSMCGTLRPCDVDTVGPAILSRVRYTLRVRPEGGGWSTGVVFESPAQAIEFLAKLQADGQVAEFELWESLRSHDVGPMYASRVAQAQPVPARVG